MSDLNRVGQVVAQIAELLDPLTVAERDTVFEVLGHLRGAQDRRSVDRSTTPHPKIWKIWRRPR